MCSEQNHRGEPVPANTWLHRSRPSLTFDNEYDEITSSSISYNHCSVDYARVPEGVILRSCQPDFDHLRQTGEYICNPSQNATIILSGTCPMSSNNPEVELLSCLEPLQYDISSASLSGHAVWGDITYAVATERGSMQMVYYEFEANFGCFDATDTTAGTTLTSTLTPNRVVSCPDLDIGTYTDQCHLVCPSDYELETANDTTTCVHKCNGATSTCDTGFYATSTCDDVSPHYFFCEVCSPIAGHYFEPWSTSNSFSCDAQPCAAGTYEMNGVCHSCAIDTYSADPGQTTCIPCEYGWYSTIGAAACTPCFSEDINTLSNELCAAGQFFTRNLTEIDLYFSNHAIEHQEHKETNVYCHQSYACLPCPPGTFGLSTDTQTTNCEACALGKYQPNFQNTHCFECGEGLTTHFAGSAAVSACVCDKGFE